MKKLFTVHGLPSIERGFTLTEILVAVTILVIAVAAIYTSFQGGLTSWTKGTARMERYLNARAALDMISREIQCAVVELNSSSSDIIFNGSHATWDDDGTTRQDDQLYFVAGVNNPDASSEYDLCEIGYYLNEDSSPSSSILMRRVDEIPESPVVEQSGASTLVSNVISLNFEYGYFNDDTDGFIFTSDGSWDSSADNYSSYYRRLTGQANADAKPTADGLPDAIEITIVVQDDQEREDPLTLSTVVYLPMSEER